ncbi:mRNA 3' end processing factor [Coemansia sp. IMI 203386]|nr:mRNA 3' end processing factor [Coemansia sp. IMI 203386]
MASTTASAGNNSNGSRAAGAGNVGNKVLYREYRGALGKLTFNSKPIINDLSKRAEANVADAETIIMAIEQHLRFSVPKLKLPAFYLLDSILKNVGGMYVSLMHGRIGKIFVEMWKSVDEEVRGKMERTLRTWRHGFDGGYKNLFPDFVLRQIEEDIGRLKARAKDAEPGLPPAKGDSVLDNLTNMQSYSKKRALEQRQKSIQREVTARADRHSSSSRSEGRSSSRRDSNHHSHSQHEHPNKRSRAPSQSKADHNQGLLQEVNKLLIKKKVELLRRPSDVLLFTILNTLKEIKEIVAETDLSAERIEEIRQQLADLDGNSAVQAVPAASANGQQQQQQQAGERGAKRSTTPPISPAAAAFILSETENGLSRMDLLQNLMARPDLINSLTKVAPGLSNSLGALLVPPHQQGTGYKDFSQIEPIPLTNVSIARSRPGIFNALYRGYGKQCSQCGWRTRDDSKGKGLMKDHMDWHFRRNVRTQGERTHRAAPRGWYVLQSAWEAAAEAGDEDVANKSGTGEAGNKDESSDAELRKMAVAVPGGHNEPCDICKEAFERRFNEDEETWEYVNAVSVGGIIYHATCQANRSKSTAVQSSSGGTSGGSQ